MRKALLALTIVLTAVAVCFAQTEAATVSGRVLDKSSAAVVGAEIVLTNVDTNAQSRTKTGKEGLYVFAGVMPGRYRLAAGAAGFSVTVKNDLVVHVQDELAENFTLQVGSVNEVVTVSADAVNINATDASVSTVVDQTYIKNMPLNGRSFQDLILLTPGIVTQSSQSVGVNNNAGRGKTGEFSVNGQRAESNYYTVDGVSANLGATTGSDMETGAGASGSVAAATALGTTQALVSVDDLQEFRVHSSTYSAEYGRNPGGQFSFETKSGTNQWHGTAFDYLRNDYFDANDWFNDYLVQKEPPLRQNNFGGTLGGPVRIPHLYNGKDKTFFLVSYEGLRLLQPQAALVNGVPDLCLRGQAGAQCLAGVTPAPAALQPALQAYPVPNGKVFGDGWAQYTASWSNPSSVDSTSVRFDHVVSEKLRLFFRFSDTASDSQRRGGVGLPPSSNSITNSTIRTYTAGASSILTNRLSNDFRLNYSSNESISSQVIDKFGGSTPVDLAQLVGLNSSSLLLFAPCYDGFCPALQAGPNAGAQKQWNLVDTVSYSVGRHQLKFGGDYRRLTPSAIVDSPFVDYLYFDQNSVESNNASLAQSQTFGPAYPLYRNFSAFAQDELRVSPRLTLSLGLRWEVNPPPGVTQGLMPYTVRGSGPATWTTAPQGTPLWKTGWHNFAPRLGAAYTLRTANDWETVVRAGGGLFFDTGQQLGSSGFFGPGFSGFGPLEGGFFGTTAAFPTVPTIVPVTDPQACNTNPSSANPNCPYNAPPVGFPQHLQLPYTLQWNGSIEQALGRSQALTISYVGAHAAKLLRSELFNTPSNPTSQTYSFVDNGLTSDYQSAQAQFQRRFSQGLTALASYTWSHCIDYGSQNYNFGYQRGNCDFDVRHNFSGAFSYDLPNVGQNRFASALVHHWGLDDRFTARAGFPITVDGSTYINPVTGKQSNGGLDLKQGAPIYLYGANCASFFNITNSAGQLLGCPGGRAINPNAFTLVPLDPTGQPARLGTSPRNFLRGFGAWQMDLGVRREFPIYENLKLQFRAEAFNIFNHPNFGAINPNFGQPTFGQATATLANSLGILSPLYQMGGSRSMQFALKLVF